MSEFTDMIESFFVKLGLIKKSTTANSAKDRLQVVVSHQRRHRTSPDYLPMLEKDILEVISKYVSIDHEKVDIKFDRHGSMSTLEVNVELPMGESKVKVTASKAATTAASSSDAAASKSKEKASA